MSREIFERVPLPDVGDHAGALRIDARIDPAARPRWSARVQGWPGTEGLEAPLTIEYSFDVGLTREILAVLERGRVQRAHVIVLDPRSGRLLAWVVSDERSLPAGRAYPAASLVKIVTAAAALERAPQRARRPCVYQGNPYRLTPSRIRRPARGRVVSLEVALATSNNQCLAQLAANVAGADAMHEALQRFGWFDSPVPALPPGEIAEAGNDYALGRLGCGLAASRITPLHAAQLVATLATGERVTPWWIDRVRDAAGRELELIGPTPARRVMSPELARELRTMLVRTTTRGTARSAFRSRRGRARLDPIRVAGKTGNLTGHDPSGRYEWFVGLAPAERPSIAVAVLQLQSDLWWTRSSQIAADVLEAIFCRHGQCDPMLSARLTGDLVADVKPVLLSDSGG